MGRYATVETDLNKYEVCCSGILASSIHAVIGEERFEEWGITLDRDEIIQVMAKMVENMSTPARLIMSEMQARHIGYRKLLYLMEWCYTNPVTSGKKLTFC